MNINKKLAIGGSGNQQANTINNNFNYNYSNPIIFYEEDIKEVIKHFSANIDCIEERFNDLKKIPLDTKNEINNLSEEYFECIIEYDFQHFNKIDNFLKKPINGSYLNMYMNTIRELNRKIITHRSKFEKFEEIIDILYNHITENYSQDFGFERNMVYIFLHYMYCRCHIGKKERRSL